jgi:hypothetical protein
MGFREGVVVQRKFVGPIGCAFGRILGMVRGISPILFPSRLGMDLTSAFGMMWCEAATFKSSFLELYLIAREKEALVSDYLDSLGTSILWNLSSTSAVHD